MYHYGARVTITRLRCASSVVMTGVMNIFGLLPVELFAEAEDVTVRIAYRKFLDSIRGRDSSLTLTLPDEPMGS